MRGTIHVLMGAWAYVCQEWRRAHVAFRTLFIVVAALHIASVFLLPAFGGTYSGTQDPLEYRMMAEHILSHGVLSIAHPWEQNPDIYRGPGYSLFLAPLLLLDSTATLAILVQKLLLFLGGFLVLWLALTFGLSRPLAWSGVLLYLAEPYQWILSLQTMTETVFTFLFLLLCVGVTYLTVYRASLQQQHRWSVSIGLAVVVSLATLAKPTAAILALPLLVFLVVFHGWKLATVATLAIVAMLSPLIVRNYMLTGDMLLSTTPYYNYVQGFGTEAEKQAVIGTDRRTDEKGRLFLIIDGFTLDGYENLKRVYAQVTERTSLLESIDDQVMCSHHVLFHRYKPHFAMLTQNRFSFLDRTIDYAGFSFMGIVYLLALIGTATVLRTRKALFPVVATVGAWFALIVFANVCMGYSRMLIPMHGPLFIMALAGLAALFGCARRSGIVALTSAVQRAK